MEKLRRPKRFMGMIPSAIIEDTAQIYHSSGEPDGSSMADVSRFGYAVRWLDGSCDGWDNRIDNKLETTVKHLNEYLASKGWRIMKEIKPKQLSEQDIVESTIVLGIDHDAIQLKIKTECYMMTEASWYAVDDEHDKDGYTLAPYIGHVSDLLPEYIKTFGSDRNNCIFKIKNGKLYAMLPKIERECLELDSDRESYTVTYNRYSNSDASKEGYEITCPEDIEKWHKKLLESQAEFIRLSHAENESRQTQRKLLAETAVSIEKLPDSDLAIPRNMLELSLIGYLLGIDRTGILPLYYIIKPVYRPGKYIMNDHAVIERHYGDLVKFINESDWNDDTKHAAISAIDTLMKMIMRWKSYDSSGDDLDDDIPDEMD